MQPWLDWFQAEYEDVRILKQTAASRIGLCRHRKTGMELVRLDLENTNEEVYRRLLPLEHPCLPRIYEVRADGDRLIVLEEFVDGVTLADLVCECEEGGVTPGPCLGVSHRAS